MTEVTQILRQIESGDPSAAENLLPLVYEELRRLASQKMAAESPDHRLQATGLVHEAYLRLVDTDSDRKWNGRGHFFAAAAEAMRRILVENARLQARLKRNGNGARVELDERTVGCSEQTVDLLSIDESLTLLEQHDRQAAQLVKLRFFAGLQHQKAAEALGLRRGEADHRWALARAWLQRNLGEC